jgi:hypothetical protein
MSCSSRKMVDNLRPCLYQATLACLFLQACSPASIKLVSPPVEAARSYLAAGIQVAEPASNEAVIVINNNAIGGTHAGLFAGSRLNDPAGGYIGKRSENKDWPGPSLADYVAFQREEDGDRVLIYRFQLTPEDFNVLDERMSKTGPGLPLLCAVEVNNLIAGIGPFRTIESAGWTTPAGLAERLHKLLQDGSLPGKCVMPDNRSC